MLRLLCAFVGFIILVSALMLSHPADVLVFINIKSLLFAALMPLFFTLAHHSPREVLAALSAALNEQEIEQHPSQQHQAVLSTLRITISASGIVGAFVGIFNMLLNMSNPRELGPAMALSLLTALYAVIGSELMVAPLINRLRRRTLSGAEEAPAPLRVSTLTLIQLPFLLLILFILILGFVSH